MKNRIVRWALTLCLLLTVAAFAPTPAAAAAVPCDGTHGEGWTALSSVEDMLDEDVLYALTPAGDNPTTLTLKAGKYYLTADIKTEYSICIAAGSTTLCLNGHTLSGDWESLKNTHLLGTNGTSRNVNLCSCAEGGALQVTSSTGKAPTKAADARYVLNFVHNNCTLNLYDVAIHDSYGRNGVIYAAAGAVVNMYSGSLYRNRATAAQGNDVVLNGTAAFHMYGGSIDASDDFCRDLYAVYLLSSTSSFTLSGGTVTGKDAENCGAVNNYGGGTFTVSGGTLNGAVNGPVTYAYTFPFQVNGEALVASEPGTVYSDDNVSYDAETGVLTAKADITLVLKLAGNNVIPADSALTLDLNGHTVTVDGGLLSDRGALTIQDSASGGVLISRVATASGASLTLTGGAIQGAGEPIAGNGGGVTVAADSTFTMTGGRIIGHESTMGGGAVFVGGTFTMSGGEIGGTEETEANRAVYAGAVYVNKGSFEMTGGRIVGNYTTSDSDWHGAGGVYIVNGSFTMSDAAEISLNYTLKGGGGVFAYSGATFTMNGGSISDNTADTVGGGVRVGGTGQFILNGGSIEGNTAGTYGGGVAAAGSTALNGGTISDNTAGTYGGGVSVDAEDTVVTMDGAVLSGNHASTSYGGGVFLPHGTFTMESGSIEGNDSAAHGAGVAITSGGVFTLNGGSVTGNAAQTTCGGVFVGSSGHLAVNGGAISGNTGTFAESGAANAGSDIYVGGLGATVDMTGGTVGTADKSNSFWGYASQEGTVAIRITDGTVLGGIGFGGSTAAVTVDILGGNFRVIPASAYGVQIYGGNFGSSGNLLTYAAIDDPVIVDSGVENFPYKLVARDDLVAVTGVSLDKATLSLEAGNSGTLVATVSPADAAIRTVTWSTDAPAVATVEDGVVTALSAGTATITVTTTDGGFTDICTVTVTDSSAPAGMPGDLSGDDKVNAKDVVLLQRYLAGGYNVSLTDEQADLNGDGKVNAKDVVLLQRYLAGGYNVTL